MKKAHTKEPQKKLTASMDLDEAVRRLQLTPLEKPVVGGGDALLEAG